MSKSITLKDVARAAGVHLSTAARAFKDDPRISAATRTRIQALARELRYYPDPMLAAFSAYRRRLQPPSYRGSLAWLSNFPEKDSWHSEGVDLYFQGALERAGELGYKIDEFWLRAPGMNSRRASQILKARGVQGLLLCPQPRGRGHLRLEWDNFSAVAFGHSLIFPKMHLVGASQFRSSAAIMRHLRRAGYRRPGFFAIQHMNERSDHLWSAAYLSELNAFPKLAKIPLFVPRELCFEDFKKWFQKWKPEVIVTTQVITMEWLAAMKLKVPRDVGIAFLNLQKDDNHCSGVLERPMDMGRTAVDMLAGMIQRGERGVPRAPLRVLVEGEWIPGHTLKQKAEAEVPRRAGRRKVVR